ncbi:MHS family dicarboxylic acid transporter PcaT-like MFS transporter [Acinetobacter calcoaceticus]|uniref:MHS family dicarboxylic acid transporter PcaT-like MFS transporter n=1 Tax=Acinetobacter calcoaceticus TaxID=471 RepID=A0A4R1XXL7_ACICA|nr:MHS family dicarboxylic acid transporter PcaT-like MFS transporter [Acinetobacter calcoaceticus]
MSEKTVYHPDEKKSRIKAIAGAASGNLVEWFDFYIYAAFAVYFQHALTAPNMNESTQAIYVWGVFAASFFMRPIGSWIFGRIGDKYGRKRSMTISIALMAVSSFLFAFLPTYDQVGMAAPFCLLAVRLLQGLSVGGEYGTVATYMSEVALKGQRGFYSSFQYVTLAGGQLLASLLGVVMLMLMSKEQLLDGGWRIPFFIGGVVAVLSFFVRRNLTETLSADANPEDAGTLRSLFKHNWKTFLLVVGYTSAGSLTFYVITVYSKTYITSLGFDEHVVGYMMTFSLFVFMIAQPVFGIISDRIGRRASMMCFSIGSAIFIYPVMVIGMRYFHESAVMVTLLLIFLMMILSFYTSISGLVKAEMFPPHIRALGVGFAYAVGNAIFGGSAPAVALQFKKMGIENEFFIYVVVMLIICLFCSMRLPKKPEYLHHDH